MSKVNFVFFISFCHRPPVYSSTGSKHAATTTSSGPGCRVHFASDVVMNGYNNGGARDVTGDDDDDGRIPTVSTSSFGTGCRPTTCRRGVAAAASKSSFACPSSTDVGSACCPPPPPPLPPASTSIFGGLRRTPYSPRYASDGRLKHFPVVTQSSKRPEAAAAMTSSAAAGQNGGPNCCQSRRARRPLHEEDDHVPSSSTTMTLGRWPPDQLQHQQRPCLPHHHHHHILPFDCNSPMMSVTTSPVAGDDAPTTAEVVAVTDCDEIQL